TGFVPGATVKFSAVGTALPATYVSTTQLKVTAPAHPPNVMNVFVTTHGGTSASSNASLYAYGPPTVTKLTPNAGPTAGGNPVTTTVTGFVPGATVKFSAVGTALPATYVSTTQLTVTAPAHPANVMNVFVTTPGGTSATSNATLYAYGPPTVSSF